METTSYFVHFYRMNRLRVFCLLFPVVFQIPAAAQNTAVRDSSRHAEKAIASASTVWWKKAEWIVPATLVVSGSLLAMDKDADEFFISNYEVWEERNEKFINFSDRVDDYLQHVPSAATFIMSLSGVQGKHDLPNQAALFIKSEILIAAIVFPLKQITLENRPDSYKRNSFPSGHTTQAFMAATFLSREYGYKSVWISVGAYTMATTVGVFRILNNRHWLSDILVGAGIGILSTNVVYATHQNRWGKRSGRELTVMPLINNGATGIYLGFKW